MFTSKTRSKSLICVHFCIWKKQFLLASLQTLYHIIYHILFEWRMRHLHLLFNLLQTYQKPDQIKPVLHVRTQTQAQTDTCCTIRKSQRNGYNSTDPMSCVIKYKKVHQFRCIS